MKNFKKSKEYKNRRKELSKRPEALEKRRIYEKQKYHTDINFKLRKSIRSRIGDYVSGDIKPTSAIKALGCTIEQLKIHIEKQFLPGMNWENHSFEGWHIDHIIPLASFDLTNPEDFAKACHYTNLQPLWALDNLKKGDKLCFNGL